MLPGVSDDENPVVWIELAQKRPHLFCAGETGLVQHVQMPIRWIGARMILTTREETLESSGVDSGLAELPCRLRGWSESFDDIAAGLRAFADRLESRGLAAAGQTLKAVNAVGRVENFLNDPTLGVIQKGSRVGLFARPFRSSSSARRRSAPPEHSGCWRVRRRWFRAL